VRRMVKHGHRVTHRRTAHFVGEGPHRERGAGTSAELGWTRVITGPLLDIGPLYAPSSLIWDIFR
jgi:hypothetical protein